MKRSRNLSKPLATLGLGLAILSLTACQTDSSTASLASSTVNAVDGKSAAEQLVSENAKPAAFLSPGEAIDISQFRGKTIAAVTLDNSLPFVRAVLDGMTEAGERAGVKVEVYDAKGSTDTAAKQVNQALAAKSSAIVAFGINFNLLPTAIESANQAGVPVIGALNVDANAPLEKGAAGEVSIDYKKSGKLLAAYAIANTEGPAHGVVQNLPSIETFTEMRKGIEEGFHEFCSSECSLQVDDLMQSNFKTAAETLTGSEISRNPKLNWIFPAIDGIAQFTIPAVELSSRKDQIRVGSINAVEANLGFIRDKRIQAVDVGNSNNWLGWAMMDRTLRALSGAEPAMSEVPVKLFDAKNIEGLDISSEEVLYDNVDYKQQYANLWK
ncbi:sugar ABC transporter substrate-binding protein [Paeniglutamicibacter kerguelensis]|uniref:Ribose transport system substrate-binding protein n=1 Tax=Paeniglutamicibacter kerguelensis TaxID=254788 RepID=A0ABS4XIX5_9MICC|nr:sugar ABC transporter substrate-binding protein [Paeniglutamicibacter kerguelensis]MBP2388416.1 ribose transport system substrate-binding protein [Paeniglutamicibacter kerguelensis]